MASTISFYSFSDQFFVAVHTFEDYASIMKISYDDDDYCSDFEKENEVEFERNLEENYVDDNEYLENEDYKIDSQEDNQEIGESAVGVLIAPCQDINVVMTFEPVSNLLNNFANKLKKNTKKGKIPNKPVTFHKKIKSSGYGTNQKLQKKPKNLLTKQKQYPINSSAPGNLQEDQNFPKDSPLHSGPIFNIHYNRNGTRLASCGGDGAAYILKLPTSKYKCERIALVGHEFSVNSIV